MTVNTGSIEKRADGELYVDGVPVERHEVTNHRFCTPGVSVWSVELDAEVLDHLIRHPELFPEVGSRQTVILFRNGAYAYHNTFRWYRMTTSVNH